MMRRGLRRGVRLAPRFIPWMSTAERLQRYLGRFFETNIVRDTALVDVFGDALAPRVDGVRYLVLGNMGW